MKGTALEYKEARDQRDFLRDELKRAEAELAVAETKLVNEMIANGQTSARFDGIGLVTLSNKLAAKIVDKEVFFRWLYDTGRESLIKSDVNYMTLQAFANELDQDTLKAAHDSGLDYEERVGISLRK